MIHGEKEAIDEAIRLYKNCERFLEAEAASSSKEA